MGLRTAISAPSKKSARCSPSRVSAFARLKPRRCVNCAIHPAPAVSARFSKVPYEVVSSIEICTHQFQVRSRGRTGMKSLFVGNMSFQTTEADLTALFQPFGQVRRIHIVTDRETGRARGFAFVEMPNDTEAAKAIAALDGKEVGGRNLKINEARPKSERQPREPRW